MQRFQGYLVAVVRDLEEEGNERHARGELRLRYDRRRHPPCPPTFYSTAAGFRVQGAGFRVQGPGSRVQGSGSRVQGTGFRVQGSGYRVHGSGFRVQGSGFIVEGPVRDRFWPWLEPFPDLLKDYA